MTLLSKEKQNIIQSLVAVLSDKAEFALVFGSIINKNFNEQSDIDVAVYLYPEFNTKEKKIDLRKEIINLFNRGTDLIFLNDADIIITMQTLANGSLIINENPSHFIILKAQKISEYIDFKISRKIIEDNMLNGRIYACPKDSFGEKDTVLSKISIIKNCLNSIKKVTKLDSTKLDEIFIQDVYVLNLQRAIQACIDIANIIVAKKGFKLPAAYKDSFIILRQNNILDKDLTDKMISMVGFRNIAVHEYQEINTDILKSILVNNLKDFEEFYSLVFSNIDKLFS